MRKPIYLSFFLGSFYLALSFLSMGQNTRVELEILNEQAEPLPFANVLEVGTLNSTISDLDGKASLQLMNAAANVQVSFIGYKTIVLHATAFRDKGPLKVTMEVDEITLAELEVIDIGMDPKAFLLEALHLFYRNSRRPKNFPKYRYIEDLTESISGKENNVELAALIIKSIGKVNRSNRLYSGKEKDSHFLVQHLYKNGGSMYDTRKDPIVKGIIEFNKSEKAVDFESDLLFKRFDYAVNFMENKIYNQSALNDLDWRITKLQKTEDETLALFEHSLSIENSYYDKIFIKVLVDLKTKHLKTISMLTDRDIKSEPLGRTFPEFKDRLAYEEWDKAYAQERYHHYWSNFLGKGFTVIHYYYDTSDTPIPKNIYLKSNLFHHTIDGDFDIQVQARLDLVEIVSGKNLNLNDYQLLDYIAKWPNDH
jgi:hypothetical protein